MMDDMAEAKRIADHPWRFKAVVEGELVHLTATFDLAGVERFRAKIEALRAVLDASDTATVRAALLADPSSTGERGE